MREHSERTPAIESDIFKAKSVSTENSSNYNITHKQNGYIVSAMNDVPIDRWPFKLPDETDEEFKERFKKLGKEIK